MKQEASKKSKLWLWLVIGIVALLAVAGVVLALVLGSGKEPAGPQGGRPELYWNVDKATYTENSESGLSTRQPGEDGVYRVRFAINGELVELAVADKQLINYIDTLDAMGLVKDADGVVVDVLSPKDIAEEVTKNAYVKSTTAEKIIANSSVAMNGMTINIELTDLTQIYDVTSDAEVPGQIIQISDLNPMDVLTVYANDLEEVTHVYLTAHPKQSKVYWRANQNYNSTLKETAREPDENGAYTIPFFCDGELVELKTKDKAIATKIDGTSRWKCHFGFTFDEEGYIIEQFASALGIGAIMVADCWDVVEMNGQDVTVQRLVTNDGSVWTGTIPEDCIIYDASYAAMSEKRQGKQVDSLSVGDRVTVWTDTVGTPILVYISNHLVDSPAYWVPSRQYDSKLKETKREIGPSGYYEVELVGEGMPKKTYYIKDKETMSYLDSITQKCVGLKVDSNNIVECVYHFEALTGYTCATQGGVVTTVTGSIFSKITIGKPETTANLVLAPNARVYNVSEYGEMGAPTTLQPNDHVYGYRQPTGEILVAFVTRRGIGGEHLYWRLEAMYDSKTKETTREPDADGWYYIEFAYRGKQVTLKTKDKDIVNSIDALSIGATALDVSGDVIKKVYDATYAYSGKKVASGYRYRNKTEEGLYHTVYNTDDTKTVDFKMAEDCVIYNVSPVFKEFQGEQIYSIPYNAMLTVFCDIYGEAKVVYVRAVDVDDMYWKTETLYDSTKKVTKRTPDEEGYYWYTLAVNGECKTFKTKNQKVANSMDSYAGAFGLSVNGDEIMGFVSTSSVKNVKGNGVNGYCVTAINGNKVTLTYNKPGSSFGKTETITLASGVKIYDVTPSSPTFGAVTELKVGDTVRTYKSREKTETHSYVYVMARSTRAGGETGWCEVCQKDVTWNPLTNSSTMSAADGHWYVTQDMTSFIQQTHANKSKDYTICLDLNGHTLTRSDNGRMFRIAEGETLNIIDSVGGGKIVSGGGPGFNGGMMMVSAGGKVNMYGGTLEMVDNGYLNGYGGNIYLTGAGSQFNLYDGTITGGTSHAKTVKTTGAGGNVYAAYEAEFNMYGGTVSNGKAFGAFVMETVDGVETEKAASGYGGNFYLSNGAKINILGGVVTGGEAVRETKTVGETTLAVTAYGGNFYLASTSGVLNVKDATISNGHAHRGGNIYGTGINTFENATVIGGTANQRGANIMTTNGTWLLTGDTKILDGVAGNDDYNGYGGNIAMHGGEVTIEKATIDGGIVNRDGSGGNIYMYKGQTAPCVLNIKEGALIQNGVSNTHGGNIYQNREYTVSETVDGKSVTKTYLDAEGNPALSTINITGGQILNGKCDTADTGKYLGGNIYAGGNLHISGGTISGGLQGEKNSYDIYIPGYALADVSVSGGTVAGKFRVNGPKKFLISGAPKLGQLNFYKDIKIDVGEMKSGAEVIVITTSTSPVFSNPCKNAQAYVDAGYFKAFNIGKGIGVTENNELTTIDVPLPTKEAYCAHCDKVVTWYGWPYGSGEYVKQSGHYYMLQDLEISTNIRIGSSSKDTAEVAVDVILDTCGFKITSTGPVFYVYPYSTLSIMDSVGTSEVVGAGTMRKEKPGEGGLFYTEKGNLNIYSGVYTLAPTDKVSNGGVIRNSGILKIYGGTINGGTIMEGGMGGAIYSTNKAEIYGGTVNGEVYIKGSILVAGTPVVDYVKLHTGVLMDLGEMKDGASVTVDAEGAFTKSSDVAKDYLQYFNAKSGEKITVTVLDEIAVGEVVYEDVLQYACPHCNGEVVAWRPYKVTGTLSGNGIHYYITDGGYAQTYGQASVQGDVVLDLHGQTLTGKEEKRLWRVEGTFTILDSVGGGKAVCDGLPGGGGAMIMTRKNPDTGETAVINMYSGTLTMTEDCNAGSNGGIISLAGGTVMNMYGGSIYGGKAAEKAQNLYISDGTFNMSGGYVDGGVYASANATVSLSGTAQIGKNNDGLALAAGKRIEVGTMSEGAKVYLTGEGVFTNDLTDPASYLAYFAPVSNRTTIEVVGNALELIGPDLNEVYDAAKVMDFTTTETDGKVTAECPVCGEAVAWYPLPANSTGKSIAVDAGHYYLSAAVDYTANNALTNFTSGKTCINLNGQTLTSSARVFYTEGAATELHLMGDGTVCGEGFDSNGVWRGGLDLTTVVNLYGGTYLSNNSAPAIGNRASSHSNAVINVYKGTVIRNTTGGIALYACNKSGLNICAGTIEGSVYDANSSKGITVSGAPVISMLTLDAGAKIKVGELTEGTKIKVNVQGVFTHPFDKASEYLAAGYFESDIPLKVTADNELMAEIPTFTAWCDHCAQDVLWTQWTNGHKDGQNAHFYLPDGGMTQNNQYTILAGSNVILDLRGQTLTGATGKRLFLIYGTLSVIDSVGGGKIESKVNPDGAGGLALISVKSEQTGTLNLYAGTLTLADGHKTNKNGGILSISGGATFNMYGGTIEGGAATGNGKNINAAAATLNISGGTIDGGIYTTADTNVTLSGTVKIAKSNDGLQIAAGNTIALDAMEDTAEVYVTGVAGAITGTLANADEYLDNIKTAMTDWVIENVDGVLMLVDNSTPFDPNKVAEQAAAMDFTTTEADGKVTLDCPVCRESVEWYPLVANTDTKSVMLQSGHYYLSKDVDYTGNQGLYNITNQQVCLNLNGQNLTAKSRAFYTEKVGTYLNVMGEGTVTGAGYENAGKWYGVFDLTTDANFYGGTYVSTGAGPAIGNRKTSSGEALVSIYNGTNVINETADGISLYVLTNASLAINGGNVTGRVLDSASKGITVSGAPVINSLDLLNGAKITVGELTENAKITVVADGIFTNPFEKAAEYLNAEYFVSAGELSVTADNELKADIPVYNVLCDHCGQEVEWAVWTNGHKEGTGHYYIPDGGFTQDAQYTIKTGADIVLDLRGQTLTGANAKRLFLVYGTLSIVDTVGNGKIESMVNPSGAGGVMMIAKNPSDNGIGTVNLYNGTLTLAEGHATNKNGGIMSVSGGATFNMYGGTVEGGAPSENGKNIYATAANLNLSGGTIDGGIYTTADTNVTLSGTVKVTMNNDGLQIAEGKTIALGAMEDAAEVYVTGVPGAFTDVLTNAADYLDNIKIATTDWAIENVDGALTLVDNSSPFDPNKVAEQAAAMDFTTTEADGKVIASCPVCRESVEWYPLVVNHTNKSIALESGHYYLSKDIDYTANTYLYSITDAKQVCLNLNGQNLTSTNRAFYTEKVGTVLNVMGEGTVTGAGYESGGKYFSVFDMTTDANFYGGTYVSTGAGPAIGNRKTSAGEALVSIYNGTQVINETADGLALYVLTNGSLAINGGTVTGRVLDSASKGITVSGAPVIDSLDLLNGAKITVGELTEGASIKVNATDVFTNDIADPAAVKDFFHAGEDLEIKVQGNALTVAPAMSIYEKAVAMDFAITEADGKVTAECPVCDSVVDWYPMPQVTDTTASETKRSVAFKDGAHHHYYLDAALDYTQNTGYYAVSAKTKLCLNLNGKDVVSASRAFWNESADTVVNIMGNGSVTGNGYWINESAGTYRAAFDGTAAFNLYGGTYASANAFPVFQMRSSSNSKCVLSIYEGTTVQTSTSAVALEVLNKSGIKIYGGSVLGGSVVKNTDTATLEISGNPVIENLDLSNGMTVDVGTLTEGASIFVNANGVFTTDIADATATKEFFSVAQGKKLEVVANTLSVVDDTPMVCPHCGLTEAELEAAGTPWTEWTAAYGKGTKGTIQSGHYYMTEDVSLTDGYYYMGASTDDDVNGLSVDVVLDMRGCDIISNTRAFYGYTNNHLTLWDSVGGSILQGGLATSAGGTIFMGDGGGNASLRLYNITVSNSATTANTSNGGVLFISGGTLLHMENCVLTGVAAKNGAAICMSTGETVIKNSTVTGAAVTEKGGAIYMSSTGKLVIENSTVSSGTAATGKGVYLPKGTLEVKDSTVEDVFVNNAEATVTLSGVTVVNSLDLTSGAKINAEGLTSGADITVVADGVFTNDLTDPAAARAFFKSGVSGKDVIIEGSTLAIGVEATPSEPSEPTTGATEPSTGATEPGTEPTEPSTEPTEPVVGSIYEQAKAMDFSAGGTVSARCPVCEATVDWLALPAISGTSNFTRSEGTHHYYLSENTDYTGNTKHYLMGGTASMCLNLNGQTMVSTSRALIVDGGTAKMNVMGDGVVRAAGLNQVNRGAALDTTGELNLYGGTYESTSATSPVLAIRGSKDACVVNMYEGTTIQRTEDGVAGLCVYMLDNGELNIYDGTISGGNTSADDAIFGGNIWMVANSKENTYTCTLNVYGGSIAGGVDAKGGNIYLTGNDKAAPSVTANIMGGEIVSGGVYATGANAVISLSGKIVVDYLDAVDASLVTVGALEEGASVKVEAADNVAFTNTIDANAETYASYFYVDALKKAVVAKENALMVTDVCPHCNVALADITWTELANTSAAHELTVSGHYKLTEDVVAASGNAITMPAGTTTAGLDLVLDTCGFDITAAGGRGFYVAKYNDFTVFDSVGGSVVTSNSTNNELGGSGLGAYAGTEVNIYDITLNGAAGANGKGNCVSVYADTTVVNIYSGTFNGTDCKTAGNNGGTVYNHGTLNIYGGTFNDAELTDALGGCLYSDGTLNIADATLNGDVYIAAGTVELSGDVVIADLQIADGMKATIGELTENASISVTAAGAFTNANEKAQEYVTAGYVKATDGTEITVTDGVMSLPGTSVLQRVLKFFSLLCASLI